MNSHNHVIPTKTIEEQGRGMSSIFKAVNSKTQILIEVPIASRNAAQSQVQSLQASTALVCLIKHFMDKIIRRSKSKLR
jgi:hypothetical protein